MNFGLGWLSVAYSACGCNSAVRSMNNRRSFLSNDSTRDHISGIGFRAIVTDTMYKNDGFATGGQDASHNRREFV
jgi:hypothetical protein